MYMDNHLIPPIEDINLALNIEQSLKPEEMELYLECLNNKPMSQRKTSQELRDGCILTNSVFLTCRNKLWATEPQ